MKKLIIANWKMNPTTLGEAKDIFLAIKRTAIKQKKVTTVICPPFLFIEPLHKLASPKISLGAQDVFWQTEGSYTGEISPLQLFESGAKYVIVGHSERRALGETDEIINKKIKTALKFNLTPILCVGEKERDKGIKYLNFVSQELALGLKGIPGSRLSKIIVAYEPVWAIGRKALRFASPEECFEMVIFIKKVLSDIYGAGAVPGLRILYGGSVHPQNAKEFLAGGGVDGFLVGRDSLDPKKFAEIINIAEMFSKMHA